MLDRDDKVGLPMFDRDDIVGLPMFDRGWASSVPYKVSIRKCNFHPFHDQMFFPRQRKIMIIINSW